MNKSLRILAIAAVLSIVPASAQVTLQNHSKTPSLVKVNTTTFPNVQSFSLISSWDTLASSPGFRFGGSADGAGLLKNADGTFLVVTNHEDNFSVSRVSFDASFKPVKGDYLLNSNAGMWRLCSATMATPEEHGFGPVFITCGESGVESMTHYVNPYGNAVSDSTISALTTLAGFGRWSAENAVPLPKDAFPGKTVVIIGDDDGGANGGQLAMYISNTGDLNNGSLYVMRRTDKNQAERALTLGGITNVEFVQIPNHKALTGDQINKLSDTMYKSIKFGRVEDIDYRKGNPAAGREIYFTVTGSNYTGTDSVNRTIFGRVYRIKLDPADPLKGTLEVVVDGDDKASAGAPMYNPDNICVTEDYVYVQEDPNGYTMPWALPYVHDARIYQYDIDAKTFTELVELDHRRSASDSLMFNRNGAGTTFSRSGIGSWEYGAMIDVSKETGLENTFLAFLQPHTFRYPFFAGIDGGTLRPNENQGSLIIALTNIPRIKAKAPLVSGVSICSGKTAVLTATDGSTFAATNGTTYKWYDAPTAGTLLYTGSSFTTPVLTANKTYYVATYVSGMESSTRTAVNVTVNNVPVVNLGADIATCGNAALDAGAGAAAYLWSTGVTTRTLNVTQSGTYSVRVANASGCFAYDTIVVTISNKPVTPVISVIDGTTLVSNKTSGNKWYKNGVLAGADATYTANETALYTLTWTDANNCTSDAATLNFVAMGVNDFESAAGFSLFPNPNQGSFELKFENATAQTLRIQVVNMLGQVVYQEEVSHFNGTYNRTISLEKEASGNYVVNLVTDKMVLQKKVVKQ